MEAESFRKVWLLLSTDVASRPEFSFADKTEIQSLNAPCVLKQLNVFHMTNDFRD